MVVVVPPRPVRYLSYHDLCFVDPVTNERSLELQPLAVLPPWPRPLSRSLKWRRSMPWRVAWTCSEAAAATIKFVKYLYIYSVCAASIYGAV